MSKPASKERPTTPRRRPRRRRPHGGRKDADALRARLDRLFGAWADAGELDEVIRRIYEARSAS